MRVHGLLEHLSGTGKGAAHARRHPELGHRAVNGLAGFRQRAAGGQVKGDSGCRRQPLVVHRQRGIGRLPFGEVGQRDRLAVAVNDEHLIQGADVLGVGRIHLHHHLILVERLVDGRDLPLAKGVVQQVVGVLDADAEARHGIPVIDQVHFGAIVLLI
ncbi:Uncharacterised protein [Klebsiella pneumoniae]|nr:Uncharacterised protein [Klebsiella pneumoniae]